MVIMDKINGSFGEGFTMSEASPGYENDAGPTGLWGWSRDLPCETHGNMKAAPVHETKKTFEVQ